MRKCARKKVEDLLCAQFQLTLTPNPNRKHKRNVGQTMTEQIKFNNEKSVFETHIYNLKPNHLHVRSKMTEHSVHTVWLKCEF